MLCVRKIINRVCTLEPKLCSKLKIMTPPEKIRPCDLQKLINSLTLKMASRIDGIPNE
jgi:hypothetical protein